MALRVFPPNVTQPRKSSLKKPRTDDVTATSTDLKGVAFQVNTTRTSPAFVQSGDQRVKHSLCDPPSNSSKSSRSGSLRRCQRASNPCSVVSESTTIRCDSPLDGEDDELSPLPENPSFGSPSSQTRLSPGVDRRNVPLSVSTEVLPAATTAVSPGGDRLSPLPERDRFVAASPPKPEYPATTRSLRSTSPTVVTGASPASAAPPYSPLQPSRQRSIFPRYDHTKPLNDQQYYPHARSPTPTLAREKVSKVVSPVDRKRTLPPLNLEHVEPTATMVLGYEHIPIANSTDLLEAWNASCNRRSVTGRKALFRLLQPRGKGTTLSIGVSEESVLWSMKKESIPTTAQDAEPLDQLVVSKNAPGNPAPSKVAQLALPKPKISDSDTEDDVVGIFPQIAAIHAIEAVATSAAATAIAERDPTAKSPEAARLALDAVAQARGRHQALLIRTTRTRHSLGAVTATYRLEHATLGAFAITVTRSTAERHSRDPRAMISVHHPSATPEAISAETLVLAFLDFARDACVLDVPALLALDGSYIVDTVVCALLGVAVIENDALMAETMTFAAPPKSPLPVAKRPSPNDKASGDTTESSQRSGLLKRNKKKKQKKDELELPVLTKGALALLGMSFKMAVWTLELGVKATAGVIVTTSHIISKA